MWSLEVNPAHKNTNYFEISLFEQVGHEGSSHLTSLPSSSIHLTLNLSFLIWSILQLSPPALQMYVTVLSIPVKDVSMTQLDSSFIWCSGGGSGGFAVHPVPRRIQSSCFWLQKFILRTFTHIRDWRVHPGFVPMAIILKHGIKGFVRLPKTLSKFFAFMPWMIFIGLCKIILNRYWTVVW